MSVWVVFNRKLEQQKIANLQFQLSLIIQRRLFISGILFIEYDMANVCMMSTLSDKTVDQYQDSFSLFYYTMILIQCPFYPFQWCSPNIEVAPIIIIYNANLRKQRTRTIKFLQ